jgi:AraC family transcriptional regulator of adaptative response/methylated-DNA-[protein]-cysteine methyltransferase
MRKEGLGRNRTGKIITTKKIHTPLGPMLAGAVDGGICFLDFIDREKFKAQTERLRRRLIIESAPGKGRRLDAEFVPGSNRYIDALETQLGEYFAGTRRKFAVPLVVSGTPFQKKAWAALQKIPYGETRSYGEQAVMMGCPNAVRAVGRANGDNRIAIVIPCHRVIGADGKLTGYGGGLRRKEYLLNLESGKRRL